ncbi:PREDICTED: diphthine methyl ester synthase-like [Priapulus caudatus]|uniref:Diphthine methyl ester synthase-like n=1 Tax=Priapulus caudatus TaxID=37621 RepID=A0ABM1E1R1_PRICU|nr:PREDICTED: diphthine methyl ester synthase-like [Priapulus caudatus]
MRLLVWGLLAFHALLRISSFRHISEFRLGLGDAEDITVKGLQIVKRVDKVYLEAYTSILTVGKDALEEFLWKNHHQLQ